MRERETERQGKRERERERERERCKDRQTGRCTHVYTDREKYAERQNGVNIEAQIRICDGNSRQKSHSFTVIIMLLLLLL